MIEDGYTSPTIEVDGKKVLKFWSEWDERDFSFANLNFKAISYIINELSCNEFHKVMNITCAKKYRIILKSPMRRLMKLRIVK